MTAFASQVNFAKLWTQSDATSNLLLKKALQDGLDVVVQAEDDTLKKMKKAKSIRKLTTEWLEEIQYPTAITGTLSTATITLDGTLFKAALSTDRCNAVVRVGTILERETDGLQVRVSSVDFAGPTYTCVVAAHGNNSLSDNAQSATWRILAELWTDFRDVDMTRMIPRTYREVGTQIFEESLEMPKLRIKAAYEEVADEWEHQTLALIQKLRRQLAYSALRMEPKYSGGAYVYGNKTEEPAMCGLLKWPKLTQAEAANTNVYVDLGGTTYLTPTHVNNLIRSLWLEEFANFNQGDWWIMCHPLVKEQIDDWDADKRQMEYGAKGVGYRVDAFQAKIGKDFPILSEQYMFPGQLALVNFSKASYGYFEDDTMDKEELATQGRYKRWMVSFQAYGVVMRNPRANIGLIYGIPTT